MAEKVEGFTMFKLVEGRMLEYWIVAGELPVLIGEAGAKNTEPQNASNSTLSEQVQQDDEYRRLNAKDIPLLQPPSTVEN